MQPVLKLDCLAQIIACYMRRVRTLGNIVATLNNKSLHTSQRPERPSRTPNGKLGLPHSVHSVVIGYCVECHTSRALSTQEARWRLDVLHRMTTMGGGIQPAREADCSLSGLTVWSTVLASSLGLHALYALHGLCVALAATRPRLAPKGSHPGRVTLPSCSLATS